MTSFGRDIHYHILISALSVGAALHSMFDQGHWLLVPRDEEKHIDVYLGLKTREEFNQVKIRVCQYYFVFDCYSTHFVILGRYSRVQGSRDQGQNESHLYNAR